MKIQGSHVVVIAFLVFSNGQCTTVYEWLDYWGGDDGYSGGFLDISKLQPVKDVESSLSKDFPRIVECGPDEMQNWYEPDPEDCSCYYGRFYVHRMCNQGLVFDPKSETCNWPSQVDCGNRPEPWDYPGFNPNLM